MTDINHRRFNKKPVNRRLSPHEYHNGLAPLDGKITAARCTGKTDFLDKSCRGWSANAPFSGKTIGASISNDFTNGHRGMARSVKGAKKFVRTRVRFHENATTQQLADENWLEKDGDYSLI